MLLHANLGTPLLSGSDTSPETTTGLSTPAHESLSGKNTSISGAANSPTRPALCPAASHAMATRDPRASDIAAF